MASIELAPEVLDDFDRIFNHVAAYNLGDAATRIRQIMEAVDILSGSPLIGRPLPDGNRELVIGRGTRGYVALYRYLPEADVVVVLAVRAQREAGYGRDACARYVTIGLRTPLAHRRLLAMQADPPLNRGRISPPAPAATPSKS